MRRSRLSAILIFVVALGAAAFADTVTGTVTNATTGKPAAGVTVTLVDPMGGMAEVGTAKCDAKGQFSVEAPPARGPRLVRAERSGVNYFKMITPGTSSIDLSVYDSASSVQGIKGAADVLRMQTQGSTLQALEMFAVNNASDPPRTLASPATFDFVLPDGATIDEAHAQAPNGQPISVETKPTGQKNQYAFSFALKPGESRLEVAYHLPYNGQASFTPRFNHDFEHYVVIVPASMNFTPKDAKQYQAMTNQPGSNVQVSLQAQAGTDLSYSIAGNGVFPEETEFAGRLGGASAVSQRTRCHQRARRRTGQAGRRSRRIGKISLVHSGGAGSGAGGRRHLDARAHAAGGGADGGAGSVVCAGLKREPCAGSFGAGRSGCEFRAPEQSAAYRAEGRDLRAGGRASAGQALAGRVRQGPRRAGADAAARPDPDEELKGGYGLVRPAFPG